jgi:hypothetical protein
MPVDQSDKTAIFINQGYESACPSGDSLFGDAGVLGVKGRKPTLRPNQIAKAATRKVLHHPQYQNRSVHIG